MRFTILAPPPFDYIFTSTHLWYCIGPILYRRHLDTLKEEQVYIFPADIAYIDANDTRRVVALGDLDNGFTLWTGDSTWAPFFPDAYTWILTPNRIVIEDMELCITSHNFFTSSFVAYGNLDQASDDHVIYDDDEGNHWQDPDVNLTREGTLLAPGHSHMAARQAYWLESGNDGNSSLICESRTAARVRMLVRDTTMATRLCKYL